MNVIYLKDRSTRAVYVRKTEELLPYDLGDLLIGALEAELPKLLPDLSREDHDRLRETY